MTDEAGRPSIEFEGKRFERRQGVWFDARTHLKATGSTSQKIDMIAKGDPALWDRCGDQDFVDDPKNTGKLRLRASDFLDGSLDDLLPQSPQPRPVGGRTRRARIGENVEASFRKTGRKLVVKCDLEPGWHETKRGWVFQESDRVEVPPGHQLRVSAKFVEQTFGQWHRRTTSGSEAIGRLQQGASLEEMYPIFGHGEYELAEGIRLLFDDVACTFEIQLLDDDGELNGRLPWKRRERAWGFQGYCSGVYELPICIQSGRWCVSRPFYIEVEAVLHEPRQPELRPEYTDRTPFASAGLPSLGKRR